MSGRYETAIVGGGPAGLTAAIHLAWHERKVVLIDRLSGPLFFTLENLRNVPGMPAVRGIDLQKRLKAQAEALGNLFYCPDCEAPEIRGKKTIVIGVGSANAAAGMAIGLSRYTDELAILLTRKTEMSTERAEQLETKGIAVSTGEIAELIGDGRRLVGLRVRDPQGDERRLDAEAFFVSSPALGRTDLAQQLGVEMAATQNHAQPRSQRGDTNVEGVWIAGDLRPMTQQVAVATGTGNIAAVMIDQYLRGKEVLPEV